MYFVGRKDGSFVYTNFRENVLSTCQRNVQVTFFYPTEDFNKEKRKYFVSDKISMAMSKRIEKFAQNQENALEYLMHKETNGYNDAQIANGQFPLIVFSHGHGLYNFQNTVLCECLAENGFIVACVQFDGESCLSENDKGEIVGVNEQILQGFQEDYERCKSVLGSKHDYQNVETLYTEIKYGKFTKSRTEIWSEDISKAIDFSLQIFGQSINKSKIGCIGMSFGGAASFYITLKDKRVKCAVDLDGGLYGARLQEEVVNSNFMIVSSRPKWIFESGMNKNQKNVTLITIPESTHFDYTDEIWMYGNLPREFGITTIDVDFMLNSLNKIVASYFCEKLVGGGKRLETTITELGEKVIMEKIA